VQAVVDRRTGEIIPPPLTPQEVRSASNGTLSIIGDARCMDLTAFPHKYGVIVADPRWPYRVARGQGVAEEQYNVLSEQDIISMPVDRLAADIRKNFPSAWNLHKGPIIALHLSARKPSQRWSVESFASVARRLHEEIDAKFLLLWSPGSADNPTHPGDDEKAAEVLKATEGLPVHPVATHRLEELIATLSLTDAVICSDGGTMHLAAALGKPMVTLFGDSDPEHWGPWKVPHVTLHKPSREVAGISVDEVVVAFRSLPPC
jgi:ADP-heptose:LPS heptosyltransferase